MWTPKGAVLIKEGHLSEARRLLEEIQYAIYLTVLSLFYCSKGDFTLLCYLLLRIG